jgi:hypothetical protein
VVGRRWLKDNITIRNTDISGYTGSPMFAWGPTNTLLVENNTFRNTLNVQGGFFNVRGNEGANPCPAVARNIIVRGNEGDQGTNGWFGFEFKCTEDVRFADNILSGGNALISLVDSNRVHIEGNRLNMVEPFWGIEIAKSHDVTVTGNILLGDPIEAHGDPATNGCQLCGHAVSLNSGSLRTRVENNEIRDLRTVVDTTGDNIVITSNHCTNVQRLLEFNRAPPYSNSTIENNPGCP